MIIITSFVSHQDSNLFVESNEAMRFAQHIFTRHPCLRPWSSSPLHPLVPPRKAYLGRNRQGEGCRSGLGYWQRPAIEHVALIFDHGGQDEGKRLTLSNFRLAP